MRGCLFTNVNSCSGQAKQSLLWPWWHHEMESLHYWSFATGIHQSPVYSLSKGAMMQRFDVSFMLARITCWAKSRGSWVALVLIWRHCNATWKGRGSTMATCCVVHSKGPTQTPVNLKLVIRNFQTNDADIQYGGTNMGPSHYSLWGWGSNWKSPLLLEFKYYNTKPGYNTTETSPWHLQAQWWPNWFSHLKFEVWDPYTCITVHYRHGFTWFLD